MAHLFCELLLRLQAVGLAADDSYDLPLTQTDIADVMGMTSVHVNRTLRHLREIDLASLKHKRLIISDVPRLKSFCSFDPAYLHLKMKRGSDKL